MTDDKAIWNNIDDEDDEASPLGRPAHQQSDENEMENLPFGAGLVGVNSTVVDGSNNPTFPYVSSTSPGRYSSTAATTFVIPDSTALYHHSISAPASDTSQIPPQWLVQYYQQHHQQQYLHPHLPPHEGTSSSVYQYVPHGSPRRRLSYDGALIITRDGNHLTPTPSSINANRAIRQHLHARNPRLELSPRSSADPSSSSSSSPSRRRQQLQRQQNPQPQPQQSSSLSSSCVEPSFNDASSSSSSSYFTPTTTITATINPTSARRHQEIITTPHDFATSVSLTQQQLVLETDTSSSNVSASETPPTIVTTAAPEETNNPLRNHEDELQFLRDQWTSVCIALSSLRNMYLAVSSSTATTVPESASTHHADPTGGSSLSSPAAASVDGSSGCSSSTELPSTSTRRELADFPIPSSIAVTSFIGRAPLPRQHSQKKRAERPKGRGKGRAKEQQQQQQGDPSSTGAGLHPDIEHELLVGIDDALLQLRQLQFRVEALEAEIHRLRTGTTGRSRTSPSPPPPPTEEY